MHTYRLDGRGGFSIFGPWLLKFADSLGGAFIVHIYIPWGVEIP